jgi:hypothetical protein
MQWFAISASPWQHLDQFEILSFTKVEEGQNFHFS